jgi:hypothetical protein
MSENNNFREAFDLRNFEELNEKNSTVLVLVAALYILFVFVWFVVREKDKADMEELKPTIDNYGILLDGIIEDIISNEGMFGHIYFSIKSNDPAKLK